MNNAQFLDPPTPTESRAGTGLSFNWIALNPLAGDVIPGTGGLRKVRWGAGGRGKRGGARVIYYNQLNDGTVWLRKRFPLADKLETLREEAQCAVEEPPH